MTSETPEEHEVPTEAAGEEPAAPADPADPAPEAADPFEKQLAERTADLQRLQAEYVNYKRRVDRDRDLVRGQGEIAVLQSLLTVLDDIGRAAEHGELEGGFKAVADSLQAAVTKHQLQAFGAKGDPFDPALHEAVFKAGDSSDVEVTTIDTVLRTGYRVGERVLRAATVGVVEPAGPAAGATGTETDSEPEASVDGAADGASDTE